MSAAIRACCALLVMLTSAALAADGPSMIVEPAPIEVHATPLPARAQATIAYQHGGPHVSLIVRGTTQMLPGEILEDLHTIGTGVLSGFDVRVSNRNINPCMLEFRFYVSSPTDEPPGALVAGPYLLSLPTTDPMGVTHDFHIDVPDAPIIPTSHLWVGYTVNVANCGASFNPNTNPTAVGYSHDALYGRPPDFAASTPSRMYFTLYLNSFVDVPGRSAGELDFEAPSPNPVIGSCRFTYSLPSAGRVRLEVYDASGRMVRTLADEERQAGRGAIGWDARDARGVKVRPGAYWARFETAAGTRSKLFVVL